MFTPLPYAAVTSSAWNDFISRIDAAGFRYINSGWASPVMDQIMTRATKWGGGGHMAAYCVLIILIGWRLCRVDWRRAGYAGLAAAGCSTIAVQICKILWNRPRPLLSMYDVRVVGDPLFAHSFPSGHTMTAFAVAIACSMFVPRLAYIMIPFAIVTGLSRVYVGAHFPLDVSYGALLGVFVGLTGAWMVKRLANRGPAQSQEEAAAAGEATV